MAMGFVGALARIDKSQVRASELRSCHLFRSSFAGGQRVMNRKAMIRSARVVMTQKVVKRVLLPIANGSEEIEATTIADTLVRAGADVTIASAEDELVCKMSRGVKIMADKILADCADEDYDLIVLPGGMPGAARLRDHDQLITMLHKQNNAGKLIGAICAAPAIVLAHHGFLDGKKATCYPSPVFTEKIDGLIDDDDKPVIADTNIMTSRGPGTSLVFSLGLVEMLYGNPSAEELASLMILDPVSLSTTAIASES